MADKLCTVIRLGSTTSWIVCAQLSADPLTPPEVLWSFSMPSQGIKRGCVSDIAKVTDTIRHMLDKAHDEAGLDPDQITFVTSGPGVQLLSSTGTTVVENESKEVDDLVMLKAIENALGQVKQTSGLKPVVHMPVNYDLDGRAVDNPYSMKGNVVTVNLQTYYLPASEVDNLQAVAGGVPLVNVLPKALAAPLGCMNAGEWAGTTLMVAMGGGVLTLTLVSGDRVVALYSTQVGGAHFTHDIETVLHMPYNVAESLKRFVHLGGEETEPLPRMLEGWSVDDARTILRARMAEVIDKIIVPFVEYSKDHGLVPTTVVLQGGAFRMPGAFEMVRDALGVGTRFLNDQAELDPLCFGALQYLWRQDRNVFYARSGIGGLSADLPQGQPRFTPRASKPLASRTKAAGEGLGSLFQRIKEVCKDIF